MGEKPKVDWESILRDIEEAVEPDKMSKQEAHEALEELHYSIEVRMEALREELGEEDGDDEEEG